MEIRSMASRRIMLTLSLIVIFLVLISLGLFSFRNTTRRTLGVKAFRKLKALDTIKGDTKIIALIAINKQGETTLYQYLHFQNEYDKPITELPGVGSFAAIPYYSINGEQATVKFGKYLPNGIERHFTVRFGHPVPPDGWAEIIMVGERMAKYRAKKLEDGSWQIGPIYPHVEDSTTCIFAVQLPADADIISVNPSPDRIHEEDDTIVWQKALSAGEDINLTIRYRMQR